MILHNFDFVTVRTSIIWFDDLRPWYEPGSISQLYHIPSKTCTDKIMTAECSLSIDNWCEDVSNEH